MNFLIKISVNLPYPRDFEYRIEATSFGTAVNRAFKLFRKELKGRKIREIKINAIKI